MKKQSIQIEQWPDKAGWGLDSGRKLANETAVGQCSPLFIENLDVREYRCMFVVDRDIPQRVVRMF